MCLKFVFSFTINKYLLESYFEFMKIYYLSSCKNCYQFSSLSYVRLFATLWTAAHQASLSITNSLSPPKPMSIELVMPCNYLILCRPFLLLPSIFPSIRVFSKSQLFTSGGQNIGASASTSIPPMNLQDWLSFGLTGLISLQSKGLSRVFFHITLQKHWSCLAFFVVPLSHPYMTTGKTRALTNRPFSAK